jgi:Na+-driven multidrug efflux pump
MEQERVTLIIIITTIIVLVFTIAMVVLFVIFQHMKNKLLIDNKSLRDIIKDKLSYFDA